MKRQVKIVGYYSYLSKTGKTARGLVRRELVDAETGELLKIGKYCAHLRHYADKNGWEIQRKSEGEST